MTKVIPKKQVMKPTKTHGKESNGLRLRSKNTSRKSLKQCRKEASTHIGADKLMKLAKELMKSHPELSMEQALRIEKQRQNDRKKRAEEVVIDPYRSCRIGEDFERYMKEANSDKDDEMNENRKDEEYQIKDIVKDVEGTIIEDKENY